MKKSNVHKGPFVVESFVTIGSFDYDWAFFLILIFASWAFGSKFH
jgi:hypothetical protein